MILSQRKLLDLTYQIQVSSKKRIEKEVNKIIKINDLFSKSSKSPASFLNKLSQKIPKSIKVDLLKFEVGSNVKKGYSSKSPMSASMTFLLSDREKINDLENTIKDSFKKFKKGKIKEVASNDPDDVTNKWEISFLGTIE